MVGAIIICMGDKKKTRDIVKNIKKHKKRVAGKLDKKIEENQRLFSLFAPIVIGMIFLICSVIRLDAPVWSDESYSAYLVKGDFGDIMQMAALDVHPPLFYIVLKMWSSVFGTTEIAMRFMSVFFGLIAIIFTYQLLKRLFKFRIAAVGTFFMAISPMFIRYSQEIRMYTMVTAIVLMATYFLSLAIDNIRKQNGGKYWIIYGVLVAVGMWTHYFTIFIWITQLIIVMKKLGGKKKLLKNKKNLKKFGLAYGVPIVLFIPWVPTMIGQIVNVEGNGFWVQDISLATPINFVSKMLFYQDASEVNPWLTVLGILTLCVIFYGIREVFRLVNVKDKSYLKTTVLMFSVPIIGLMVCSLPPFRSMFVDRYVLYSIVLIWIFVGVVAGLIKDQKMKQILIALVVLSAGFGIFHVEKREPSSYTKEILGEIFMISEEKEPIIMTDYRDYYDGIFYTSVKHPIYIFNDDINYEYGSQEPIKKYKTNLIENREDFLAETSEFWYVVKRSENDVVDVPETFSDYYVKSEISLTHYTALELAKN